MVDLRVPKIFNLRSDPFERADHDAIYYNDWLIRRVFLLVPAQGFVARWISSFKEFPPSQKPASFSIDQALEKARQLQENMAAAAPKDAVAKKPEPAMAAGQ
jgi:hypothetical protein